MRENITGYTLANSNFSFTMNRAAGSLGNSPVYNQFNMDLSSYKLRTIIDTKMPLPVAIFRFGGFTLTWYVLTFIFVYAWNYFNSEIEVINALYTFTAPTRDVRDVVQGRRDLDFACHSWFCRGDKDKRELYNAASLKKDKELDIANLANAWRIANFLGDI